MLATLSPLLLFIIIVVVLDSGGAFFGQIRVGKNEKPFKLWKFRTMQPNSELSGQITIGAKELPKLAIYFGSTRLMNYLNFGMSLLVK